MNIFSIVKHNTDADAHIHAHNPTPSGRASSEVTCGPLCSEVRQLVAPSPGPLQYRREPVLL